MRPADRGRVAEMTATVWDGHDYIDRVFDDWVADPGAWFQAAEVDGEVAGIQRLRPIAPGVIWYEGLRVAEESRRRGLAREMLAAAAQQATGLGFADLRLVTGNPAAAALFTAAGFRLLAGVDLWRATRVEGDEPARMASPDDAERLARAVLPDPATTLYGGIIPDGEWALDIDAELIRREAQAGRLRVAAGGRALAHVRVGWGGDRLWVSFITGSGGALRELATALRFEADSDALAGVSLWAPAGHPGADDLRAAGYDSEIEPFRLMYFALRLQP